MVQLGWPIRCDCLTQRGGPGGASHARDCVWLVERVGLSSLGEWGCFSTSQRGVLQPFCQPAKAGYEMSAGCLTGLDEPSWVQCDCAGTVPVACDVRGDIARGPACFCSAQLVRGEMTWSKTMFAVKIIRN